MSYYPPSCLKSREIPYLLSLACCLCLAACGSGDGSTGMGEGDDSANPGDEGEYGDGSPRHAPGESPYTLDDPEEALAAIPSEMRPKEMLDELKNELLVPNVETGGRAMFTDIVTVEPGADVTFCTYLDHVTEDVSYIHDTLGRQTRSGHHAILQYLGKPQEPGTRECPKADDLDNQAGQILGGTGGEGNGAISLPSNVVTEIPAGSQFLINHHWINTGEEPIEVQAEMITVPPEPGDELMIARAFTIVAPDFEIAPGEMAEASVECAISRETRLLSMIGHEHSWGTHVKAERLGDVEEVIFDHEYTELMISEPLTTDFPLEAPFLFDSGDTVRMTCQWHNTTETALTWPREMCVLFGWQIGADKDEICYNGNWL